MICAWPPKSCLEGRQPRENKEEYFAPLPLHPLLFKSEERLSGNLTSRNKKKPAQGLPRTLAALQKEIFEACMLPISQTGNGWRQHSPPLAPRRSKSIYQQVPVFKTLQQTSQPSKQRIPRHIFWMWSGQRTVNQISTRETGRMLHK